MDNTHSRERFPGSEGALARSPAAVAPDALQKAATLFRAFGEEYHEQKLEEAYIFPAVKKAGGLAGSYADILIANMHEVARLLTISSP